MKDLMIDLETLGVGTNTPVISIGAVFFDIEKKQLGEKFYFTIQVDEQLIRGRKPTWSTIKWWMNQSDVAKSVFNAEGAVSVEAALKSFTDWYKAINPQAYVWGNGATFDISIMENLFGDYGLQIPWRYNKIMDVRTYKRFNRSGKDIVVKSGVKHNALDDAVAQANFVMGIE